MLNRELAARTALAISIAGIALLFIATALDSPKEIILGEISQELVGKQVRTKALVQWTSLSSGILLFGLYDGNTVKVVKFNPSPEEKAIVSKGLFVSVSGVVQDYKGEIEIVAERIEKYG